MNVLENLALKWSKSHANFLLVFIQIPKYFKDCTYCIIPPDNIKSESVTLALSLTVFKIWPVFCWKKTHFSTALHSTQDLKMFSLLKFCMPKFKTHVSLCLYLCKMFSLDLTLSHNTSVIDDGRRDDNRTISSTVSQLKMISLV